MKTAHKQAAAILAKMPAHAATLRAQKESCINAFADGFAAADPAFNRQSFLDACNPRTWEWEYTDTFGGQANYSWIKRGTVRADTLRGAMILAKRAADLSGIGGTRNECGSFVEFFPARSATVLFVREAG